MWDGFSTRPPPEGRPLRGRGRVENPSHIPSVQIIMRSSRLAALTAACIVLALLFVQRKNERPFVARPVHRIAVLGDSVAHGAGDESNRGGIAGRLGATNFGVNGA